MSNKKRNAAATPTTAEIVKKFKKDVNVTMNTLAAKIENEEASDINDLPPSQPTNACTATRLDQLNEDCLLEIFSKKYLNSMDLCSLAETCRLFRRITQRIVPKEIHIVADYLDRFDVEFGNSFRLKQKDMERIFKNFGSRSSAVKIEDRHDFKQQFLLKLPVKHCNAANLTALTLHYVRIPEVFAIELKPILKGLQKLDLESLVFNGDATLFGELDSLVELRVYRVQNSSSLVLENIFPKLKHFQYTTDATELLMDSGSQTLGTFSNFISHHKSLTKLQLDVFTVGLWKLTVLDSLFENCRDLEDLNLRIRLDCCGSLLQPLQTLKSLKTLTLSSITFKDFNLFSALHELRELILFDCSLPNDFTGSPCLPHLKKVKLIDHRSGDVADMVTLLTNLEVLEYRDYGALDEEIVEKIVAIASRMAKVVTMKTHQDDYHIDSLLELNKAEDIPAARSIEKKFFDKFFQ